MAKDECEYTETCVTLESLVYFKPTPADWTELKRDVASEMSMPCYEDPEESRKCPTYELNKQLGEVVPRTL